MGFAILAIVSALGGGMLRDTLLQAGPPVALTDPFYLGTALLGAVVAFLLPLRGRWWDRLFLAADGIVLGCWAATTAVGGGIIRDVVVGRVPAVFGGNTLYATSAIFASLTMIGLDRWGHPTAGMLAAIAVGAGLSLLARWRRWVLPDADALRLFHVWPPRCRRDGGEPSPGRVERWWRRRLPGSRD